jgi:hypothetical protein
VPGATPSSLVIALGKDGSAYLVSRDNLGGIIQPVASTHVANSNIIQAPATYQTNGTIHVAFRASPTTFSTFRITPTNPPTIASSWSVFRGKGGCGSPFVTSTDGINNTIVWVVGTESSGSEGDQLLHGYDGATGDIIYDGGGANELIPGTHSYSTTGIVAHGRIYVAADNKVYAFAVPPAPRASRHRGPDPTRGLAQHRAESIAISDPLATKETLDCTV